MVWGAVFVKGPIDEDVYVNGIYNQPAGKTNSKYMVEFGKNKFETLDKNGKIALQAEVFVNQGNSVSEVELKPDRSSDEL